MKSIRLQGKTTGPAAVWVAAALFVATSIPGLAQGSSYAQWSSFYNSQTADAWKAMANPTTNQRVMRIWLQLAEDTRHGYPIVPAQNYTAGMALPNGVIVLDLAIAGNDASEVTAFFLAHEWAHQEIGHPRMMLTPMGSYMMALGGTSAEDSADRWAARFLKRHGYDLDPVVDFLNSIPDAGSQDSHSSGPQRARNVSGVFSSDVGSSISDTRPPTTVVPCTHPLHPQGDMIPCSHPAHMNGDAVPCSHLMPTPWGPRQMHQFDVIPCSHPMHAADVGGPCQHPAHPGGDVVAAN